LKLETVGETQARALITIGLLTEWGRKPTTYDVLRALGISLYRTSQITNELKRKGLIEKRIIRREKGLEFAEFSLTAEGTKLYKILKEEFNISSRNTLSEAINKFNERIYEKPKVLRLPSNYVIRPDPTVVSFRLPEILKEYRRRGSLEALVGTSYIIGLDVDKLHDEKVNIIDDTMYGRLRRAGLNIPLNIAGTLVVSLITNFSGKIYPTLNDLIGELPYNYSKDEVMVRQFLHQSKALGEIDFQIRRVGSRYEIKYIRPKLSSAVLSLRDVVNSRVQTLMRLINKLVITKLPLYRDLTERFPTIEEVLNGETELLKVLYEYWGRYKYEREIKAALLKKSDYPYSLMKIGLVLEVKVGDERRLLTLSAAERLWRSLGKTDTKDVIRRAAAKLRDALEGQGMAAKVLKYVISKGVTSDSEIRSKFGYEGLQALKDLEIYGFIHRTYRGTVRSPFIIPAFEATDPVLKDLIYITMEDLNILTEVVGKEHYWDILEKLIRNGELLIDDLMDITGSNARKLLKLGRILQSWEVKGLIRSSEDTIKTDEVGKKIIEYAVVAKELGKELGSQEIKVKSQRSNMKELAIKLVQ